MLVLGEFTQATCEKLAKAIGAYYLHADSIYIEEFNADPIAFCEKSVKEKKSIVATTSIKNGLSIEGLFDTVYLSADGKGNVQIPQRLIQMSTRERAWKILHYCIDAIDTVDRQAAMGSTLSTAKERIYKRRQQQIGLRNPVFQSLLMDRGCVVVNAMFDKKELMKLEALEKCEDFKGVGQAGHEEWLNHVYGLFNYKDRKKPERLRKQTVPPQLVEARSTLLKDADLRNFFDYVQDVKLDILHTNPPVRFTQKFLQWTEQTLGVGISNTAIEVCKEAYTARYKKKKHDIKDVEVVDSLCYAYAVGELVDEVIDRKGGSMELLSEKYLEEYTYERIIKKRRSVVKAPKFKKTTARDL